MGRVCVIFLILPLFITFLHLITPASDLILEKGLQKGLEQSKAVVERAGVKLRSGYPVNADIWDLKELFEEIRTYHLLVGDHFKRPRKYFIPIRNLKRISEPSRF